MTWYDMKSYIYKYTLKLKNDVPKFGNLKFFVYICKNPMLFWLIEFLSSGLIFPYQPFIEKPLRN